MMSGLFRVNAFNGALRLRRLPSRFSRERRVAARIKPAGGIPAATFRRAIITAVCAGCGVSATAASVRDGSLPDAGWQRMASFFHIDDGSWRRHYGLFPCGGCVGNGCAGYVPGHCAVTRWRFLPLFHSSRFSPAFAFDAARRRAISPRGLSGCAGHSPVLRSAAGVLRRISAFLRCVVRRVFFAVCVCVHCRSPATRAAVCARCACRAFALGKRFA